MLLSQGDSIWEWCVPTTGHGTPNPARQMVLPVIVQRAPPGLGQYHQIRSRVQVGGEFGGDIKSLTSISKRLGHRTKEMEGIRVRTFLRESNSQFMPVAKATDEHHTVA